MTLTVKLLVIAAIVLGIILPFGYYLLGEKSKARYKKTIAANVFFYFGAFVIASIMLFTGEPVHAAEAGEGSTPSILPRNLLATGQVLRNFLFTV